MDCIFVWRRCNFQELATKHLQLGIGAYVCLYKDWRTYQQMFFVTQQIYIQALLTNKDYANQPVTKLYEQSTLTSLYMHFVQHP